MTALALAFAPAFPAFAHADGPETHTAQAAAAHAHHAHDGHGEPLKASPCSQHEGCSGPCCAVCAQCFTAASVSLSCPMLSLPVWIATAEGFHPLVFVARHDRPPRIL